MGTGKLLAAWLALMLLLAATVLASFLPIGEWRQVINLGIAVLKTAVILAVFMGLRREALSVRLAFATGGVLLVALAALLAADYASRPEPRASMSGAAPAASSAGWQFGDELRRHRRGN